eukprot:symbB.v1.2.023568.t1/scaffold2166.1/size87221/1
MAQVGTATVGAYNQYIPRSDTCSGPSGPLLVVQAGVVCLDLSWKDAGLSFETYLTDALEKELIEMVLSRTKEDAPRAYIDVNLSRSNLRLDGMSLIVSFLCRLHKVSPPICVQNMRCYQNHYLGDDGIKPLLQLISSQPHPIVELHLSSAGITDEGAASLIVSLCASDKYPFQSKPGLWTGCWLRLDSNEICAPNTLVTAIKALKLKGKKAASVETVERSHGEWTRYASPTWATNPKVTPAVLLYMITQQGGHTLGPIGSAKELASSMRWARQCVNNALEELGQLEAVETTGPPKGKDVEVKTAKSKETPADVFQPKERVVVARWRRDEKAGSSEDPKRRDSEDHGTVDAQAGVFAMDFSDVALGLAALLVAVISALVAVLVASTFAAPPPPKRSQLLGDTKYDIQDISTPTASGTSLRFLSWLLADSPLGPLIRRALLSQEHRSALVG